MQLLYDVVLLNMSYAILWKREVYSLYAVLMLEAQFIQIGQFFTFGAFAPNVTACQLLLVRLRLSDSACQILVVEFCASDSACEILLFRFCYSDSGCRILLARFCLSNFTRILESECKSDSESLLHNVLHSCSQTHDLYLYNISSSSRIFS